MIIFIDVVGCRERGREGAWEREEGEKVELVGIKNFYLERELMMAKELLATKHRPSSKSSSHLSSMW